MTFLPLIKDFRITQWVPRVGYPEQMSSGIAVINGVEHEFVFDRECGSGYRYIVRQGEPVGWLVLYWNPTTGIVDSPMPVED